MNCSTTDAGYFPTLEDALNNRRRLWGLTLLEFENTERRPEVFLAGKLTRLPAEATLAA
jgi:hypothetical protein